MFTLRLLGNASLEGPDGPVAGRAALRQRVALLALLAIEHPRPLSRDKVLACLWPESGTDEARHLLRDTLYILRTALSDDAVLSTGDDLRLNPQRLSSDLWEFDAAFARDDPEAAVGVYHGPFLSGFHFAGASEFERWAEAQRSGLARRYGQALERLAERETHGGDPLKAVEWWRRLAIEDPGNSRVALRYMRALAAVGDRAGAMRHATVHTQLLRTELEAQPDAEVAGFAEKLRHETGAAGSRSREPGPISSVTAGLDTERKDTLTSPPVAEPGKPTRRRWILPAALLVLALGVTLAEAALSRRRAPHLNPQRVAVAVFENHTGRPDLDDLGSMTADWIIRGLMETPLIDVTDVEAVYAGGPDDSTSSDPRELARRNGAGLVISGNYYRSGDSLIFQAGIVDVASGQVLRSFDPVGAPLEKPSEALKPLREGVASGLGAVMNPANQYFPVDPGLIPPPNYAAYREFIAGLRSGKLEDLDAELRHYRQSIALDSSFIAPLVQLAYRATWNDQCPLTDSIANALEPRREHLTAWDRYTIDLLRTRCRGDMETALALIGKRNEAYPRSFTAKRQYATALQLANQPRAAQQILRRLDPELDPPGRWSHEQARAGYSWWWAASHHTLGHYLEEVEITDRWRDSSNSVWWTIRGRALAALGREREVFELFRSLTGKSINTMADPSLTMATELAVHGHPRVGAALAESILVRVEAESGPPSYVAWANRLLGRKDQERVALEQVVRSDPDSLALLEAKGRIAVLDADTAEAELIDGILAVESARPLSTPTTRAAQIVARAHIAAGFGRRERAVALLREASARGIVDLGPSFAYHTDLLLQPLRGYPPFDALLRPDN